MIDLKEKTDDIKELEIPEIKNENNEEALDPYGSTDRHIIALRDQRIGLHHGLCGL